MQLLDARSFALILPLTALGLLLLGCQGNSSTQEASGPPPLPEGELAIENPWVRPAPAGSSSTLYMTIANGRSSADTLLDADAPIIDSTHVYAQASDTTAALTTRPSLTVPAQTRVALTPDGPHVALRGLQQPLREGEALILNLEFAQSGLQRIRAPIQTSPPSDAQ